MDPLGLLPWKGASPMRLLWWPAGAERRSCAVADGGEGGGDDDGVGVAEGEKVLLLCSGSPLLLWLMQSSG